MHWRFSEVIFESLEEISWTLDGEFGGEHDHVVVRNAQKELQIMVDAECKSSLMAHPGEIKEE